MAGLLSSAVWPGPHIAVAHREAATLPPAGTTIFAEGFPVLLFGYVNLYRTVWYIATLPAVGAAFHINSVATVGIVDIPPPL
jgi:hypothetical protein